jgi:inorganic pyrophosphatase
MSLCTVSYGPNMPQDFNVIIEIPAHSQPIKYEVDKETGALFVDRFMATAMRYPCDYGYIPQTLADDGDPVDVLVISPMPLSMGTVIRCRAVGVLDMTDESGHDYKIIAVPVNKLTPLYKDVKEIEDLSSLLIAQIHHFFEHYKDLEPGKWVKIEGFRKAKDAQIIIENSVKAGSGHCTQ